MFAFVGGARRSLSASLMLAAATLALIGAAPAWASEAAVAIGSLYEPQNLDNTAGAGQGINEAFNGNVYEALFRLNDDGSVSPSPSSQPPASSGRCWTNFLAIASDSTPRRRTRSIRMSGWACR